MNSCKHYAFGAVGDWMYQTIGGIDIDSAGPGYRRSRIAPRPGAGLTSATASLETVYGTLSSAWRLDGRRFTLDVAIPANTSAEVTLWDTALATCEKVVSPLTHAPEFMPHASAA